MQWWTHGRLVTYNQPNPAQEEISTWLIKNPQRTNLGNIGFTFGRDGVTENDLQDKTQELDMWTGRLASSFVYNSSKVEVETWVDPDSDTVAIGVDSKLLRTGLALFFDFPYPDLNKFNAPFVGLWNATDQHSSSFTQASPTSATITHTLGQTTYFLTLHWQSNGTLSGPSPGTHRYFLTTPQTTTLRLTATFSPSPAPAPASALSTLHNSITKASRAWWKSYWTKGAFVDLISPARRPSSNATELQRRIILSQYLLAVNAASSNPPQESGLVNNGWYGKFHLEMNLWNTLPFARWGHFSLLWRSLPGTYARFQPSSVRRAAAQGYAGARWGKMTDPTGRSAPGEINSLLVWQQPHPMFFAETQYRAFPNASTLAQWDPVLAATADFMASFAVRNRSTGHFDLGPPMYPVSENTNPNATRNPTFELAYWRFGLDVAARWRRRQGREVPARWIEVRDGLAPLPVVDGTYAVYEGVEGMWTDNRTTNDHPAMAGVFGLLPPPPPAEGGQRPLDMDVLRKTAEKIRELWALEESYGWDFAMLAMNVLRLGNPAQAVEYLLHPIFRFDDAGYPIGGSRVPTPYFPNSASLLLAIAMMAGGWDGDEGPHFPEGWEVDVDGFLPAM